MGRSRHRSVWFFLSGGGASPNFEDFGLIAGINYGGSGTLILFVSGGRVRVPIADNGDEAYFFVKLPNGQVLREFVSSFEDTITFKTVCNMYGTIPATFVQNQSNIVESINIIDHQFLMSETWIADDGVSIYETYGIIEGKVRFITPDHKQCLAFVYNGEIFPLITETDPLTDSEFVMVNSFLNDENEVLDFDSMLRNAPRYIVGVHDSAKWAEFENLLMNIQGFNVHPVVCANNDVTPIGQRIILNEVTVYL